MSNSFQDLAREIARSQNLRKFNVDTFLNGNALAVFPPTPVTVNPNETPGEMKARIDASQKNTDLGNVFVGGARDAIQGAGETISEIGNFVGLNIPPPRLPEVDKPEGTINNIARGFVQFGTGMLASPVKGFGIGKNIIRGAFSDSYFDPEEGGFVTFLREMGVGPEMLEILDTRVGEDATAIERLQGRLGNAVEGSVLGGIVDTVQYIKQNPHLLQKARETIVEAGKKIGTDAPKNLDNKDAKKLEIEKRRKETRINTFGYDPNDPNDPKNPKNKFKQDNTKLDIDISKPKPRDESSGHASDFVPVQFGPPAHDMNMKIEEEFTPDGFSTMSTDMGENYENLKYFITSRRGTPEYNEEVAFYRKLFQIKGNPDAEITIYRASPTDDLRYGDLITPIKSDAEFYVEQSKVTRKDIVEEERKIRLQSDEPVNLKKEKMFRDIDSLMELFPENNIPSNLYTYKVKAKDIRWDGNNGLIRWGYFPEGDVKSIAKIETPKSIEQSLSQKYPNIDLSVFENENGLTLSKIVVSENQRSEGIGTKVMNDLIDYADKNNLPIGVTPDTTFGGSKTRLESFYKKFGFVRNKGRNKDFNFRETFVRQPKDSD